MDTTRRTLSSWLLTTVWARMSFQTHLLPLCSPSTPHPPSPLLPALLWGAAPLRAALAQSFEPEGSHRHQPGQSTSQTAWTKPTELWLRQPALFQGGCFLQPSTEQLWALLPALVQQKLSSPLSHTAFPLGLKATRSKFFPSFEASPRLLFRSQNMHTALLCLFQFFSIFFQVRMFNTSHGLPCSWLTALQHRLSLLPLHQQHPREPHSTLNWATGKTLGPSLYR